MTALRGRWLPLAVLVAAAAALIASLVWVVGGVSGPSGPTTMMGGVAGEGPVRNMADADQAAGRFAGQRGLHVGEVMQFSNGYYAELLAADGSRATEVLIDPGSGTVQLESGPAMMWNTAYGMMSARDQAGAAAIGPDQAVRIADLWLREHRTGLHAGEPDRFPGYYTLHTLDGDHIVGMLSVNATTGAVWYHTWHGQFLQMQEHPDE
ncbi:hypothetical protein QRX60_44485 [Amycolatopsis mongoliensis]|uniref:PepSY domain-containing protein n=1 Tax=Amycolatopsis mongoliensis TaxID=715475 RepID=A0A9Y2JP39_9PSEU|nr:hypothetical protein [Amycolatopsis sp. 4-36]WIY01026.1 hypothetical protein QRX60_44485 [Amycolatopsis sp. 4-36]